MRGSHFEQLPGPRTEASKTHPNSIALPEGSEEINGEVPQRAWLDSHPISPAMFEANPRTAAPAARTSGCQWSG